MRTLPIRLLQAGAICVALLDVHSWPSHADATSVVPIPWRLAVYDAAFVGIVECETAGIITADFRVIQSFKGPRQGAIVRILLGVETWQPHNRTALVGEQYLVYANRQVGSGDRDCLSSEPGCGEPYWWRVIPCSLSTDPYWGFTAVDVHADEILGTGHLMRDVRLSACQDSIRRFLGLTDEEQEALVLNRGYPVCWLFPPGSAPKERSSPTLGELLDSIMAIPTPGEHHYDDPAWRLGRCGGDRALALLRSPTGLAKFGSDSTDHEHPIARILRRRGQGAAKAEGEIGIAASAPDSIDELQKALERIYPDRVRDSGVGVDGSRSFARLTMKHPESVASFLMSLDSGSTRRLGVRETYGLASYFGWKCSGNRAEYYRTLLGAPNPVVRTAAAVYLSFEDSLAGTAALHELTREPGFPGAWAAVALASRGDKSAAPRALDCLQDEDGPSVFDRHDSDLKRRLLALLSNSAKASGVPQPPEWQPLRCEPDAGQMAGVKWLQFQSWWAQVRDKITLFDPWFPQLARQRVD